MPDFREFAAVIVNAEKVEDLVLDNGSTLWKIEGEKMRAMAAAYLDRLRAGIDGRS